MQARPKVLVDGNSETMEWVEHTAKDKKKGLCTLQSVDSNCKWVNIGRHWHRALIYVKSTWC